jgi:integrase
MSEPQRLAGHADPRTTQGYYAAPETPVRLK